MQTEYVDLHVQVEEMYRSHDRIVMPLYPWVLVRPLDRAGVTDSGLVVMPERQNKPNLESVVLAVWKPFWENVEKENTRTGEVLKVRVWNASDLAPGDHIVHPHHVGLPDSYLNEKNYRYIKEEEVVCKINYKPKEWIKDEVVTKILSHMDSWDGDMEGAVNELMEKFDIVPKYGYYSLTTSGK
jgi:co-chaperonin GroES (HSP10)